MFLDQDPVGQIVQEDINVWDLQGTWPWPIISNKTEENAYNLENIQLCYYWHMYLKIVKGLEAKQATSSPVHELYFRIFEKCVVIVFVTSFFNILFLFSTSPKLWQWWLWCRNLCYKNLGGHIIYYLNYE